MDFDEVTLDWGGNDDEEGVHMQIQQQQQQRRRPETFGTADEATLSGAESLLALAAGASGEGQDDDSSDVVSLGGGEDDLEELYAYQNRTHLGGGVAGDPKQPTSALRPIEETNRETNHNETKLQKSSRAASPRSHLDSQNPSKSMPDEPISDNKTRSKSNSQAKARITTTTEPRSPSIVKIIPPTGPLALPPKPVVAASTPYVRPSHPSIMSASSMAAPPTRDREREFHDSVKKSRSHASPESDVLPPLAPNWEVKVSRDGSQERYYYNTKTKQSTWSRSIATGQASDGTAGPRDSSKEVAPASGKRSPQPHTTTTSDSGSGRPTRSRPSRFDTAKPEASSSPNAPLLSLKDRHYSPPHENGNSRPPRPVQDEPEHSMRQDRSPENLPPYPVSHRANDKDISGFSRPRGREQNNRSPFNDGPSGRNGERRVDRSRSRSPGRGRWSNENAVSNPWGRDASRFQANEHRPEAPRPPLPLPQPQYAGSKPPSQFRGAPQAARASSVGCEERPRYPPPNLDQSSFRDRRRSPPPLPLTERPLKRGRSRSPEQRPPFGTSPSQPLLPNSRWGDAELVPSGRNRVNSFGAYPRDRPHLPDSPPTFAPPPNRFRPGYRDEGSRGMDFDRENDAKRQKTFDSPDSAPARRPPRIEDTLDSSNDDPRPNRARRNPLPPQSERYKEMASTPSAPPLPVAPPPRHAVNGTGPPVAPSGPRHDLPSKGPNLADFVQQARMPAPPPPPPPPSKRDFEDTRAEARIDTRPPPPGRNERPGESNFHEDRGRGKHWDREADRDRDRDRDQERPFHADLPTGPRAMDTEPEPSMFSRRGGRSPPREQRATGGPPTMGPGPRNQQPRGEEFKRSFSNQEPRFREQERPVGPRGGDNNFAPQDHPPSRPRYNHQQQQQQNRPPFNPPSTGGNGAPVAPRSRQSYTEKESWPPMDSSRDGPRDFFGAGEREPRKNDGPGPLEDQYREFGNRRRRTSFNAGPESNNGFPLPPPPPRASVSPQNQMRPLPDNARRNPRQRNQPFYQTSPSMDDRQFRHDEDKAPLWMPNGSAQNRSPLEPRRAFSGSGNQNARFDESGSTAQPPPAPHPRDRPESFKNRFSRSPRMPDARLVPADHDSSRPEGSFQHSKIDNIEAVANSHNGLTPPFTHISLPDSSANVHPDRVRSFHNPPRQTSPPPATGRGGIRIRRHKFGDKREGPQSFDGHPGGEEPANFPPRVSRQNSLLERISDSVAPVPPLHQRVGPPPQQWNRPPPATLRDRLDGAPTRSEDNFGHSGSGNGYSRETRGAKSRRGRGQ